eukprot:CAMPEP_0172764110 /NCGR_PEP_ID=MMETSP1074-20121228/176659_1 /TAXON_ID=2916 /ORGANISM="Ceratium fusus, Strain PA161109" /LENGTH=189 /DNA_ID=CAMNT_0013598817 /DNA_START=167 /DNA_END=735 /DNA_ORIENTATION=-
MTAGETLQTSLVFQRLLLCGFHDAVGYGSAKDAVIVILHNRLHRFVDIDSAALRWTPNSGPTRKNPDPYNLHAVQSHCGCDQFDVAFPGPEHCVVETGHVPGAAADGWNAKIVHIGPSATCAQLVTVVEAAVIAWSRTSSWFHNAGATKHPPQSESRQLQLPLELGSAPPHWHNHVQRSLPYWNNMLND